MADTGDALDVLAQQLGNGYGQEAAAAAWDILNLGERLADASVWQHGVDSVQAMAAAQSCREARRYLLSPASGRPAQAPQPTRAATGSCAHLLDHVARVLQSPSGVSIQPDATVRQLAAAHATTAHQALSARRRTP